MKLTYRLGIKIINLKLNDQEMVKFADSASAVRKMNLAL